MTNWAKMREKAALKSMFLLKAVKATDIKIMWRKNLRTGNVSDK